MKSVTISALNSREAAKYSCGFQLYADSLEDDLKMPLVGFFAQNTLDGILDASDFDQVPQVELFLGSAFDVLCRNEDRAEATAVFISYVDFACFSFMRRVE